MTRRRESNVVREVLELLTDQGFDGMAYAIEVLLNEAMKLERSSFLAAKPYERSPERRGHSNGFKPKTVRSRLGKLELRIPQVRDIADGGSTAATSNGVPVFWLYEN